MQCITEGVASFPLLICTCAARLLYSHLHLCANCGHEEKREGVGLKLMSGYTDGRVSIRPSFLFLLLTMGIFLTVNTSEDS